MADSVADPALNAQAVNRMLGAGADVAQSFQQGLLGMNNGWNQLALTSARTFETTTQLLTYNGAMELSGNALQLSAGILNARQAGGQPQSGGGPGQPVSYPVQQQLPTAPNVYSVNPTTGVITKA